MLEFSLLIILDTFIQAVLYFYNDMFPKDLSLFFMHIILNQKFKSN